MLRSVVVAFDGSPSAEHALLRACELVEPIGARLVLVAVAPSRSYAPRGKPEPLVTDHQLQSVRRMVKRRAARVRASGIPNVESIVLTGFASDAIIDYVESNPPDLLVLGARGLSRARRMLLGGVSTTVVNRVSCAVLVVPEPRDRQDGPRPAAPAAR